MKDKIYQVIYSCIRGVDMLCGIKLENKANTDYNIYWEVDEFGNPINKARVIPKGKIINEKEIKEDLC